MLNERVIRAEHHLGYMRNFLSVYTPTVTLIFLLFAWLGYRSYSDVTVESAKVQKTAQDFYTTVNEANQRLEAFSKKEKHFEEVSSKNDNVVSGVEASVTDVKASVTTFQLNLAGLCNTAQRHGEPNAWASDSVDENFDLSYSDQPGHGGPYGCLQIL